MIRIPMRVAAAAFAVAAAADAAAFGIAPIAEEQEGPPSGLVRRIQAAVARAEADTAAVFGRLFQSSVHEEITHAAYGCTDSPSDCDNAVAAGTGEGAPRSVIQGVQWNDNPPFKLQSGWPLLGPACFKNLIQLPNAFPECWGAIFGVGAQSSALARRTTVAYGPRSLILLRSHFGDLQFLHAMAARDGEPAHETRDNILAWASFAWQVGRGDITPDTVLSSPRAGTAARLFPGAGMDVTSLFTLGSEPHSARRVQDMAFGSLLHVVEDSFSAAHVEREPPVEVDGGWAPGCIDEFHSYGHQDHNAHANADTHAALSAGHRKDAVVGVLRQLKAARRTLQWGDAQPIVAAAFRICPGHEDQQAGAGRDYALPQLNPQTPD